MNGIGPLGELIIALASELQSWLEADKVELIRSHAEGDSTAKSTYLTLRAIVDDTWQKSSDFRTRTMKRDDSEAMVNYLLERKKDYLFVKSAPPSRMPSN